jgi:beta-N-acetylhexosaminidase
LLVPLLAAAALTLPAPAAVPAPSTIPRPVVLAPSATLPLDQAAGQRIIASLPGTTVPAPLAREIRAGRVAGVILFSRNIASRAQLRALTGRLQAERRRAARALRERPLLVMLDQEGGLVKRLAGAPHRSPAQLGRIGSVAVARAEGLATGRNLRSVGVNVDLAPVLDVGRPGSSVRALGRSFGSTATRVTALACAKHFPGLGRGGANEDDVFNRIAAPLAALRATDEAPFRAAAQRGIPLVMVSTGVYPALDAQPALFSPMIATDELRGTVGFGGVAISDDLEVPALAHRSPEQKALAAVRAGEDLLLFAQSAKAEDRGFAALVRAVGTGAVTRSALDAGSDRVLALRDRLR